MIDPVGDGGVGKVQRGHVKVGSNALQEERSCSAKSAAGVKTDFRRVGCAVVDRNRRIVSQAGAVDNGRNARRNVKRPVVGHAGQVYAPAVGFDESIVGRG